MHNTKCLVGNPNQLVKVRRVQFLGGMADGVKAIEVHNANGIYVTCIEDQCLNLYDFSYKGINFSFQTKNGLVSNKFFNATPGEFSYYWPAGMMYTCGLTNTGPAVDDHGIQYPEHGRIGMMPAENVAIQFLGDTVRISGTVHESMVSGYHVLLERTISIPHIGKEVQIHDRISNLEALPVEFMFLYHFNYGYPFLTPNMRIVKGAGQTVDLLSNGIIPNDCLLVGKPEPHKREELYCHTNTPDKEGYGYVALINDATQLGSYLKYDMQTLPLLVHWKNMCSHDYCVGLEPSNTYIKGRKGERNNETLPILQPYETVEFKVTLGILDGKGDIQSFEKKLNDGFFQNK